jgi:hypothetical protein
VLQRKSHLVEDGRGIDKRRRVYKRPLWRAGMAIFVISNVLGSCIQITTLPLVILAPLQAVVVV